jgi:hypothetical protein
MSPVRHASDEEMNAATWCRHLIPDGSVYAFLADHRHELFPSELFADVVRQGGGHPSVPAEVVATVMVLQALEGLSDREAISALRRDIAWKVACGLRLDDEGFHPTVLVYWRNRLVPAAREVELAAHDYDQPGKPQCAWDDPQATQALVSGLVNDALSLLAVLADAELGAEQAEAVALLALVAGQDVEPGQRPGSWRIARKVATDRVISTVDPQARHTRKTNAQRRDGYKAHLAAEPRPGW